MGSAKPRSCSKFVIATLERSESRPLKIADARRRLGVTVSKRVGNAVTRNRIKRCIREWFRQRRTALPAGSDTVVIARRSAGALANAEIARALDGALPAQRVEGAVK